MVNINIEIDKLIDFALDKNMISKWDIELSRNEILDLLDLDSYEETAYEKEISESPVEILERISMIGAAPLIIPTNTVGL